MGPSDLQPRRDLTLTHATSLVVGITIGTGIFLKSAAMAQAVGTPALVLAAWVAAGVVAMFGALCFAELGALLPEAGGEYVYLRAAFADVHDWSNLAGPTGSASGGLAGFGAAMFAALWAYSGWQYLPMAAGEVQDPQRNLPRAIIGGSLLVLAIYLAVNTAYLYALPLWQVASANSTAYPEAASVAARAVQTFLGSRAAAVAALIFLISTVGSLNGTILARARVSYAAARDGLFFAGFGRLSPRTRVPLTSLVLLCIWAALLAVSGTFDQLTNMAVMSS